MARDHRKLRVFHEAHSLVLAIYRETHRFPRDEWFGIRSQIRRAAVSVVSNIVEGNARRTSREYVSFLNVARASAAEALYLTQLSTDLGYLSSPQRELLSGGYNNLIPQLETLVGRMESLASTRTPLKTKD
jgi:four helix bundle protein